MYCIFKIPLLEFIVYLEIDTIYNHHNSIPSTMYQVLELEQGDKVSSSFCSCLKSFKAHATADLHTYPNQPSFLSHR